MRASWWWSTSAAEAAGAVVATAFVGLTTNWVTGDQPTAWLAVALVGAVLVLVVLALWRVRERSRAAQAARDRVLTPLTGAPTPAIPVPGFSIDQTGPFRLPDVLVWLSAAHCPTPLWGRNTELGTLMAWCLGAATSSWIAIVSGCDGVGKKRLAVELARTLPTTWHSGHTVTAAGVAEAIENCGDPCLVVVTDADQRTDLADLIRSLAGVCTTVRMLLLTHDPDRVFGMEGLPDTLRPLLTGAPVVHLGPIGGQQDRLRWFNEAVHAYATAWRTPPPSQPSVPVGDDGDVIATLLCRAVLAVLNQAGVRSMSLTDLMDALWRIQVTRWTTDTDPRLPASARGETALAEIITAMTVHPTTTALSVLPRFATTSSDVLAGIVDWVHDRLPIAPDGRVDLVPRLLAGHLLLTTLRREPTLTIPALHNPATAAELAAALARAVGSHPAHLAVITDVLRRHHAHRATMISVLLTHGVPTPELDSALAGFIPCPAPPDLLQLPIPPEYPHTRCAQFTALVHDLRQRDRHSPDLAAALVELARHQAQLSRHPAAANSATEAVTLYRRLTRHNPDAHKPELAGALYELSGHLWKIGKHRKALRTAHDAVARYRELVNINAERYTSGLANALHSLAKCRAEAGDPHSALHTAREGIALRRKAAQGNPETELPSLATDLLLLGIRLAEVGLHAEALTNAEETAELYTALATQDPRKHQANLACAINNLAIALGEMRRPEDAAAASEAAIQAWQTAGSSMDMESQQFNLANSYHTLSNNLAAAGRPTEALTASEQAVMIWRTLAQRNPARHNPSLAMGLAQLSRLYTLTGRPTAGRKLAEDAVTRYRSLIRLNADRHKPDLGDALDHLSASAAAQGDLDTAIAALAESIDLDRDLADRNPGRHIPRLAARWQHLAHLRITLSDTAGAVEALQESSDLLRPYAEADPQQPLAASYQETINQLRQIQATRAAQTQR